MVYCVSRTTVYLPDELKAALERTAAAQGTSEAEVVRSALLAATIDADASIVVLAGHRKVQDVLTLDECHFRTLSANGKPFRLFPADD
jgi:Ribbon-helix-helix protein, copG family